VYQTCPPARNRWEWSYASALVRYWSGIAESDDVARDRDVQARFGPLDAGSFA
jgi:hypothetical protein